MSLSNFSAIDLAAFSANMAEMRKGAEFLASGINDRELKDIADQLTHALAEQEADFLAKVPGGIAASQKEYEAMQKEYEALAAELKEIEARKKELVAKMVQEAANPPSKKTKVPPLKPTMLAGGAPVPEFNQSPDLLSELLNLGKKPETLPANAVRKPSGNIWENWGIVQPGASKPNP
jgi:hypothetical protein